MGLSGKIVSLAKGACLQVLESLGFTSGGVPTLSDVRSMVIVDRLTTQAIGAFSTADVSWTTETRDDLGISAVGAGANVKVCTFAAAAVWDANVSVYFGPGAGYERFLIQLYDSANAVKATHGQTTTGDAGSGSYLSAPATFSVVSGDYVKVTCYTTAGLNIGDPGVGLCRCTLTRRGT